MTLWYSVTECDSIESEETAGVIPELETVYTMGAAIIGEKLDHDTLQVVKVISTDPALYLLPGFQPGQSLSLSSLTRSVSQQ